MLLHGEDNFAKLWGKRKDKAGFCIMKKTLIVLIPAKSCLKVYSEEMLKEEQARTKAVCTMKTYLHLSKAALSSTVATSLMWLFKFIKIK